MQHLKTLSLPLAMLTGFLFSDFFAGLNSLTPWLIFLMLFITFCRINPSQLRFSPMLLWLLLIQVCGGIGVYFAALPLGETVAQAVMICVFAPTAVAAVVIASMLGASVATMASFAIVSNLTVAFTAPVFFSAIGAGEEITFWNSVLLILSRVGPLLLLPVALAFLLEILLPRVHSVVKKYQISSYYIWVFSVMIVTGKTVQFIKGQHSDGYFFETAVAAACFAICFIQFLVGRRIGLKYGDPMAGGQALGQKNTVLAIWMTHTYLSPMASIGPASYVLWQNLINSWQLWKTRGSAKSPGRGTSGE